MVSYRALVIGFQYMGVPDLVDGQVANAVRLDVFERGPVSVRARAQRQIDFVDHDGFHIFDAQLGNSCGPNI